MDQRAGVRFLTHNVRDEFDDVTHIARLYRIKTVPCFAFLSEGAMVSLLSTGVKCAVLCSSSGGPSKTVF